MSTALVLPDPERTALPALRSKCREIFDRRDDVIGSLPIDAADKYRRQATAIERFIGNREGHEDAQRAARVLECAVGAALGPSPGSGRPQKNPTRKLDYQQIAEMDRVRFRLMLEYRDVWESILIERGLSRAEVLRLIEIKRHPPAPPPVGCYRLILADPPWRYEHVKTESRAVENQYPTMELEQICALQVPAADDCVLFLWATSPKLAEALHVITAWGFEYRTHAVWDKQVIGMGYYFRQQHEDLLVAMRGQLPVPEPVARVSSIIKARRTKHSTKPAVVYDILETMYPEFGEADRVELFSREPRPGWSSWGNEPAFEAV